MGNGLSRSITFPLYLWRVRPRFINNPVILRELIERLRNRTSFLYLGIILIIGWITFLMIWHEYLEMYGNPIRWVRYSREMFMVLNFVIGSAIALMVPLISASCINLEYEQKTWELLSTTPLSLMSILLGKFLSSVFYVWVMMLSMIPIYGLCLTMGGVSPQEIMFTLFLFMEIVIVVGLIGIFCSIRWKRITHSITATYFFGFMYMFGISFARPFLDECIKSLSRDWGPEMVVSPVIIAIVFFVNERLPNEVGRWVQMNPYQAHVYMNIAMILFLVILCVWFLSRKINDERGQKERIWRSFLRLFRIPRLLKDRRMIFRDGQNPVYLKDLRELYGESYSRLLRSILIYFGLGFLVLIQFDMFGREWAMGMASYASLLVPFIMLPFAANTFRGELDRDTWEILRTSTLTSRKIVSGKFWAGFLQFQWKFWAFYGLLFVVGYFLSRADLPVTPSERQYNRYISAQESRHLMYMSLLLCNVSGCFYLSLGMYCSTRMRKTVAAYALPFTITLMLLIGMPFFIIMIHEIFRFSGSESDLYPFMCLLSPFFLIILREDVDHGMWTPLLLFQMIWLVVGSIVLLKWTNYRVREKLIKM